MFLCTYICADSSSPQISAILVGHFAVENDSLRKSPRFSSKLSQQLRITITKSWLAKFPRSEAALNEMGDPPQRAHSQWPKTALKKGVSPETHSGSQGEVPNVACTRRVSSHTATTTTTTTPTTTPTTSPTTTTTNDNDDNDNDNNDNDNNTIGLCCGRDMRDDFLVTIVDCKEFFEYTPGAPAQLLARPIVGRRDDTVGNPHRAQFSQFELFELIFFSKADQRFPVDQFEATVSQSTVPSPPLTWGSKRLAHRALFLITAPDPGGYGHFRI